MATKHTAEQDAVAAEHYIALAGIEVFQEKSKKRVQAVRKAAEIITLGYSLRGAAKAAGRKPDNSLQRYFTVAAAMLATEEGESKTPCPEGFGSWLDAVEGMTLEDMVSHVAAHRPEGKAPDASKAMRGAINTALRGLETLLAGKGKGKGVKGLSIGRAQLSAYVSAWIEAGCTVKGLDSMTLTPLDTKGSEVIAALHAAVAAQAQDTGVETGDAAQAA